MQLPFTKEQFFNLFAAYNEALWPALIALWIASVAVSVLLLSSRRPPDRWISALLAAHWAWSALAYHAAFFTRINPAAWLFAALFLLQAALFFWVGVVQRASVVRPVAQRVGAGGVGPHRVLAGVSRDQRRATSHAVENPDVRRSVPDDDLHGRPADARRAALVAAGDRSCDVVSCRRIRGVPDQPLAGSRSMISIIRDASVARTLCGTLAGISTIDCGVV